MDPILLKCLTFLYQQVRQVQRDLLDQRDLPDPQVLRDLRVVMVVMVLMEVQDLQDLRVRRQGSAHHQLLQDR